MAFKLPFGNKGEAFSQVPESNIPVSQVLSMRAQGMNNNQDANQLRAQGFSLNQIRDAMAQADIKGAVMPPMQQGMPMQQQGAGGEQRGMNQFENQPGMNEFGGMPDLGEDSAGNFGDMPTNAPGMGDFPDLPEVQSMPDFGSGEGFEQVPEMPPVPEAPPMAYPQQMQQLPRPNLPMGRNEELVDELQRIIETLIEEKWGAVEQKMNELETWKVHLDEHINSLDLKVSEMETRIDGFAKTVAEKAEGYKETVEDVGTQMIAIEKMMGKLVPSLAEEIKELRTVVGKMKKK